MFVVRLSLGPRDRLIRGLLSERNEIFPCSVPGQVVPPVARDFQWTVPWSPSAHTLQPEAFRKVSYVDCGMGLQGAVWREDEPAEAAPRLRSWPKRAPRAILPAAAAPSAESSGGVGSGGGGYAGGSVPAAGGSVPAVASQPSVAVLTTKRGKVIIRSAAQHQNLRNCDVFVDLATQTRRIFVDTDEDGRSEAVQEQVLDHDLQTLLMNLKNTIRRLLVDKTTLTVNIQSHHGKHRSVAMAEVLKARCTAFAEVELHHMSVSRWDPTYPTPPMSTQGPPKHGLVFRPEFRNAA